jgi:hypothetical protein
MGLLCDVGHVETHFAPFGDKYSMVTWIKQKLILIRLEIVFISAQDRCTVCVECTTGMEMALGTLDGTAR